jgi:hypothetical protein
MLPPQHAGERVYHDSIQGESTTPNRGFRGDRDVRRDGSPNLASDRSNSESTSRWDRDDGVRSNTMSQQRRLDSESSVSTTGTPRDGFVCLLEGKRLIPE